MGDVAEKYIPQDMDETDLALLEEYKENGLPGLFRIQEIDVQEWFNLYMSGKTYQEIAEIDKVDKALVLYVSYKGRWAELKMNHYVDVIQSVAKKASEVKVEGANTIASIISGLNKYYAGKFNDYLRRGDDSIIENIDPKILTQYYKSLEAIDKLMTQADGAAKNNKNGPNVNINVGAEAQVKQNEDGSLDITDKTAANLLLSLSKMKKDQETQE